MNRTNPNKIVIRGVNWLGDAVMTTPALLRLRERFPASQMTLIAPAKIATLWENHPAIDKVLSRAHDVSLWTHARELREERFDLALILPNSPRSALELWLAGVPRRIGYKRPLRNWFLTHPVSSPPGFAGMRKRTTGEIRKLIADPAARRSLPAVRHQIHDYLHLVGALGASTAAISPLLHVTPAEITAARETFKIDHSSPPLFGLNAGAEYGPAKRWPARQFIDTATAVSRRTRCQWLILGGKGDVALASQIQSELEHRGVACRNVAGQTSLRELMALLKSCAVVLTNDTGPMHVAAALGTPVVVPFGSTSAELTGPGLPGDTNHRLLTADVPCAPCFLRECPIDFRCMRSITVDAVTEATITAAAGRS